MTTISDIQKRTKRQRVVALVAAEMVLRKGTRAQFSEIASAAGQMYPVVGQYWNWLTNEASFATHKNFEKDVLREAMVTR